MKKYSREVVMGFGVLWDPKAEAERRVAEEGVGPQPGSSRDRNDPVEPLRKSQSPNTSERSDGPGPELGPIARKVYKFETVHTCSPGPLAVPPEPDTTAENLLGPGKPNGVLPPDADASPVRKDPDSGSRRRHCSKGKRSSPKEEADDKGAKRPRKAAVAMAHTAAPPPPISSPVVGLATEFTGTKTRIPETTGTHTVPWLALDTAVDGSNDHNGDSNNREVSPPPILPIPQIPGMEHMEEVMDDTK